jgi:hypothetical protein
LAPTTSSSRSKKATEWPKRPAGSAFLPPHQRLLEAHLTIVFTALAVSRQIEHQTGWSIRKFVRTACRYHIIQI